MLKTFKVCVTHVEISITFVTDMCELPDFKPMSCAEAEQRKVTFHWLKQEIKWIDGSVMYHCGCGESEKFDVVQEDWKCPTLRESLAKTYNTNHKYNTMNDPKMKKLQQAQDTLHAIGIRKESITRLKVAVVREKVDVKFPSCSEGDVSGACFSPKSRLTLAEVAISLLQKEVKELEAQYKKL